MENSPTAAATDASRSAMKNSVALELIRGWKWFAYVPAEGQQWLAERAIHKQIAKGQFVYTSGDPFTAVYAVNSGMFRIYAPSHAGDEITLEEIAPGGWFPHRLSSNPPKYFCNCVCQQDATVIVIPLSVIEEFAQRWPGYYRGTYEELTDRAVVIIGRIELLSLHNLKVRLAVYLLRMAQLRGTPEPSGAIWILADDRQSEIGARVGATRQRVNSILKAWVKSGIIELHKEGMRLLKPDALTRQAENSGFPLSQYLAGWHGGWRGKAP
jgi:CRP/FNR family transcriptional regulator